MVQRQEIVSIDDVRRAAERLDGVVRRTPLERNDRLSRSLDADVWLKREDLQVVRSYKLRGAYNLIAALTADERAAGVACASAGNHAQGVAFACRALGVDGVVYVPHTTPRQKLSRIAALGGDLVRIELVGHSYDDAQQAALAATVDGTRVLVPPFDDARVVAGQGTVAIELLDQLGRRPDVIVAPVGGGGLVSGIAVVAAELRDPPVVVGVEPAGAASMAAALAAGGPVTLEAFDTFVDGAAVRRVGELTYRLARALVDEVVSVAEGHVCSTMLALYQQDGVIAEPAGALSVAAITSTRPVEPGSTVVCVISGGNNDVSRYGEIIERSLLHEGLKHYFLVEFPQEPGALRRFLDEVLGPDDDITLFEYVKKNNRETGPALVGIELAERGDLEGLLVRMEASPVRIERVPPGSPIFSFLV